jgi:hypothetical protein
MDAHLYANLETQGFNFEIGAKASYKNITGTGGFLSESE